MKFLITSFLIISTLSAFTQKQDTEKTNLSSIKPTTSIPFFEKVNNEIEAQKKLRNLLQLQNNENLKLLHSINSPNGHHYTFIQTFKNFEVYQAHIKLNTDLEGNVTSLFSSYQPISNYTDIKMSRSTLSNYNVSEHETLVDSKLNWKLIGDEYHLVKSYFITDTEGHYTNIIYNSENELIDEVDLLNHYSEVDSTVKALVFVPNPVTSAHTTYGGKYVDNNDATSTELDNERDTVDIDVKFENGLFTLENKFVKVVERSLPNIPAATSTSPQFFFNRSETGFEDVNALYHITQQQKYIQSLGFNNIVNYQINIDCHGFNGGDNSTFSSGTHPPSITFGEGGVDDAEDADVIIHEYTHAIMYSASPNTNFGSERMAIEEAFGDYMAASYSRKYTDFQDSWVYKWDGHNEYWEGRKITSNKTYPDDLVYHLYGDAPLWSSALSRIERNLGRDYTIKLAIQSAYNFTSNMTMAQAAELYLNTDQQINGSTNYPTICWIFKDKGMINSCSVPKPDKLLGIETSINQNSIQIKNTEQFAKRQGNLTINSNLLFNIRLFDITGKLLLDQKNINKHFELNHEKWKETILILEVSNKLESKKMKIPFIQ